MRFLRPHIYPGPIFAVGLVIGLVFISPVSHLGAAPVPAASKSATVNGWNVQWQPAQLVNGSPIVFQVSAPARLSALSAKWMGHDVFFTPDAAGKVWYGIAGISLETHPGAYPLEL